MKKIVLLLSILLLPVVASIQPDAGAQTQTMVLDKPVARGSDDAEQRVSNGAMTLDSDDLDFVRDQTVNQVVGLRFTNITIPQGSTITAAHIRFVADESTPGGHTVTIRGQAANNTGTFTTATNNIFGRLKTQASVAWTFPQWVTGNSYMSPSVVPVVQEIVNRAGWASNNSMVFIFTGYSNRKNMSESFESGAPPLLHLEYQAPVTTTTTSTTVPPTTTSTTVPTTTTSTTVPTTTTSTTTTTTSTTTTTTTTLPPGGDTVPVGLDYGFPNCFGPGRNVVDVPDRTSDPVWRVDAPPDNTTYDLRGVTVTNQPSSSYPFSYGRGNDGGDAALNTCIIGGNLRDDFGSIEPGSPYTWRFVHDNYNASCLKHIGVNTHQTIGLDCRGIEDGFRPQEDQSGSTVTPNNARFLIEDSYLGNVLDDCLENDYISEGVVLDSLWDGCVNGLSERPSGDRCEGDDGFFTPPDETLVVDHLLMRLRPIETEVGWGYGRLFKFAKCLEDGKPQTHNNLVIKCSTFLVPDEREDGGASGGAMDVPFGTTVDDSNCPNNPTTIVWLGGGNYPGSLRGLPIRVTSDINYWNDRVADWHSRH